MVSLSSQEEARLLRDYEKIAWKMVHQFSSGRGSSIFSKEDLYQECMLVLVKHMQKCETLQDLRRIQTMNLVNAMTRYVLKNQAVRLDHNRTDQAKRIIENCPKRVSIDEAVEFLYGGPESIEDLIENITLEQFVENCKLRPMEKISVMESQKGLNVVEIAEIYNKPHQTVSYALKSAKKKYDEFVA